MCYKRRDTIGKAREEPAPSGVHYDRWMGPAPKKPFTKNRFHYNWHWQWDYGCGDMGNQGVHEMDVARWGLGVGLPTKVSAIGGHFMFDDDQETPNTLIATFEFDNPDGSGDKKKILVFEVRHWDSNPEGFGENKAGTDTGYMVSSANNIGNLFYGSKGYMVKNVDEWRTYLGKDHKAGPTGSGLGNHFQNFIDTIRANDPNLNNGKIEEGVLSCSLIHLANISYRVGRSLDFDPVTKKIINDSEANELLAKEYREPYTIDV
jgi:predicted dehydrogenase